MSSTNQIAAFGHVTSSLLTRIAPHHCACATRSGPMRMRDQMNHCGMGGQMLSCDINQSNCSIWSCDVNQIASFTHAPLRMGNRNRKCPTAHVQLGVEVNLQSMYGGLLATLHYFQHIRCNKTNEHMGPT